MPLVALLAVCFPLVGGCGDPVERAQQQVQESTSPRISSIQESTSITNPLERTSFLIEEGQPQAALQILGPLMEEQPRNVKLRLMAVRAHAESLDVPAALALLEEAKGLGPTVPEVWVAACTLSYDTEKFAQAEEECSEAIRLTGARDDDYYARLNRGLARVVLGKLDGAYEDFQRCKQIDPDNAEAYYDESWVWAARGDVQRTIENVRLAGQRNGYYASRAVVEGDRPYHRFATDPRWRSFLEELNSSTPRFHIPALLRQQGISGVPRSDSAEPEASENAGEPEVP